MEIVYILSTSRGGIPHYVVNLANAVAKYEDVTLLKPEKTSADNIISGDIKVINAFKEINLSFVDLQKGGLFRFENIKNLASYRNIKIIREIDPEIIHTPNLTIQELLFLRLYKLDHMYPVVTTIHGVPKRKVILPGPDKALIHAFAVNIGKIINCVFKIKVSKYIVHTQLHRDALVKQGINIQKVVIIPHGVYNFFRELYKEEGKEEKNTILFFGNIVPVKGLDILIDAIPIIAKEIPDVKLIIAGDGVIPKKNWQIIEKYKSNFEIHNYFIPNEEVGKFFSRACIVVIPNRRQEGHSGSLTVAYSFGKPVVTTNVGEFPILVRDAGCGLVVPPENPNALAEAIIQLLKDDKLRKKMSKNALKMAEKLSWDNIAKMHIKVYEEVLDERRGRS